MNVKFPFEERGHHPFGTIRRPVAKITFYSPNVDKSLDVWMIVDTGADYSILPRHFSEKLRISLKNDCSKSIAIGVGGEQTIYFYKKKIKVTIGHLERKVPIAFFDSNEIPALLGRLGFMETFDMEFLKTHTVVFKD